MKSKGIARHYYVNKYELGNEGFHHRHLLDPISISFCPLVNTSVRASDIIPYLFCRLQNRVAECHQSIKS